jgi:multidrug resistance efflux pump
MEIPQDKPSLWLYGRWLGVVAGLVAAVYAAMSLASSVFAPAKSLADLPLVTVQQGILQSQVTAFGQLVPAKVHTLIAMVEGRVQHIQARPGDNVSTAQPLLQLVNPQLVRQLEQQQLALQSQEAEFILIKQQLAQEKLQLEHDRISAAGELKLLQTQLHAKQQLYQQQIVSGLDFAQSQVLMEQAQQQLRLIEEKIVGFAASSQSRLQAAELQLQRAQKLRDIAQFDVNELNITADITGQLISLDESLKPGSRVDVGQALGQVADPQSLIAELNIAAMDAASVKVSQAVLVNIKGKTMPGVVTWVSPNVTDNYLRVDVRLQGQLPDTARANIEVSADIEAATYQASKISSRPNYVKTAHQRYPLFVYEASKHRFVRREVLIGDITQQQMQIADGITLGEQFLLVVPANLMDRMEINVEELHG